MAHTRKPYPFRETGVTLFVVAPTVQAAIKAMSEQSSDGFDDFQVSLYETAASALKEHRHEYPESTDAALLAVRIDLETFKLAEHAQAKFTRYTVLFPGDGASILESRCAFKPADFEWLLSNSEQWLRLVSQSQVDEIVAEPHTLAPL